MECRICNSTMKKFLDLGRQPIANNFLTSDAMLDEYFYRLELFFCPECYSVQIGNCPDKEQIFNEEYAFFTSTSNYMIQHFKELAQDIKETLPLNGSFVVEIGSNDGTFLKNFRRYDHLGIEPSENVNNVAKNIGLRTWNDFFCKEIAEQIVEEKGQADVIVTTNVFPHMIDRKSVLEGIKLLLKPNGVWVNEEASLNRVLSLSSYDQFYNEHVFFSSTSSFKKNMELFDLYLTYAQPMEVHGGSIIYYVKHKEQQAHGIVSTVIGEDKLKEFGSFEAFGNRVENSRRIFLDKLFAVYGDVVGYGATAKSTTVLNYCHVGTHLISKIYDTTPIKQNKFSPGMHIPIVPYYEFERDEPKDVVLFAWNHQAEIMEKEKGKNINWIIPI